ncbi:hypothetical protein K2X05_06235 [bacterium]|nr:hypothetical protein [bacterium]
MDQFFASIPKIIIGPMVVILVILYFVYDDPPKTVCDLQFEVFKQENENYLYGYSKKGVKYSPEYQQELAHCQQQNSPGACFAWKEGIKRTIHSSRNIPNECNAEKMSGLRKLKQFAGGPDAMSAFKQWMTISLYTFSQISWNESTVVRKGLYAWLDEEDMLLYCRLKNEYIRLYGLAAYTQVQNSLHAQLIKLKKLPAKDAWERTILSYRCPI